jgi:crotonobetainyl-CoA:carnitine CoA-transferase CaiB-like acyl-CoA transferase
MQTIGKAELVEDGRFKTAIARTKNRETLDNLISEWTAQYDMQVLEEKLHNAQVPATRIFTLADIFDDPHYRARETIAYVDDEELGPVALAAIVPRLSGSPGKLRHPGRRIGADTKRILRELGGLTADEIANLEKAKIIGCAPAEKKSGKSAKHEARES